MNETRRFQKRYHTWTRTIQSVDFSLTPRGLIKSLGISQEEYSQFLKLPIVQNDSDGILLINESFPDWKMMKNLAVSLDVLPDMVLADILAAGKKRFENDITIANGDTIDICVAKVVYTLIPHILWIHSRLKEGEQYALLNQ